MSIPLGVFNYSSKSAGGASFKYNPSIGIYKPPRPKLFYKAFTTKEITKKKFKLLYKTNKIFISKNTDIKLFYAPEHIITKHIKVKILSKDRYSIYKYRVLNLSKIKNNLLKFTLKNLQKNYLECTKNNIYNLSLSSIYTNVTNFTASKKMLAANKNKNLVKLSDKQLEKTSNVKSIVKFNMYRLERFKKVTLGYKPKFKHLKKVNNFNLFLFGHKQVYRENLYKNICKAPPILYTQHYKFKKIYKIDNKYLHKEIIKRGLKIKHSKYLYLENCIKKICKIKKSRYLDFLSYREIYRRKDTKLLSYKSNKKIFKLQNINLLYKENCKNILLANPINFLERSTSYYIYKLNTLKMLDKYLLKEGFKINNPYLLSNTTKVINKYNTPNLLQKDITYPIFKNKLIFLNKEYTTNIFKLDNIRPLEVVKSWWVLPPIGLTDPKILPGIDYNYCNNALPVNRRDREYGNIINQDKHPISFMPYLLNWQGIDLDYGLKEINLSIPIMLHMVNLVGYLVHAQASLYVNCSGQEAMEFILETIIKWLNLDSTIKDLYKNNSMEHYLRCYRWIRWEAEKIWFMADIDHSIDEMHGLKFAGMLFANLLDYMKNHHFNLVPLILPLHRIDQMADINKPYVINILNSNIDKKKAKRHYYIEMQQVEDKKILGKTGGFINE